MKFVEHPETCNVTLLDVGKRMKKAPIQVTLLSHADRVVLGYSLRINQKKYTSTKINTTMENQPFQDVCPIEVSDFPLPR